MPGTQTEQERQFWMKNFPLRKRGFYGISDYDACAMLTAQEPNPNNPNEYRIPRQVYAELLNEYLEDGAVVIALGGGCNDQARYEVAMFHDNYPEGKIAYYSFDSNELAAQDAQDVLEWNKACFYDYKHVVGTPNSNDIRDLLKHAEQKNGDKPNQIVLTFVHSVYSKAEEFAEYYKGLVDGIKAEGYKPNQICVLFVFIDERFDPIKTVTEHYPKVAIPALLNPEISPDGQFILSLANKETMTKVRQHGQDLNALYPNKENATTWEATLDACGTPVIDSTDTFFNQTTVMFGQGR